MYYRCSENKGADQLRGHREADLPLCFSHMQKSGFLMTRLNFHRKEVWGHSQHAQNKLRRRLITKKKEGYVEEEEAEEEE